jgi:kynureninase
MKPNRKVILSDNGNFPTDLYMAQGLIDVMGKGHTLRIVDPNDVWDAIDDSVAVVLLTHVDYRTGRMYDMDRITKRTHDMGAISIWDLAHSAGAVEVNVEACQCEFAVGCTYKYLNGGPGARMYFFWLSTAVSCFFALSVNSTIFGFSIFCSLSLARSLLTAAFIYARPDLIDTVEPALAGWLGHARPFAFEREYHAVPSISRFRVGTPPVIQMSALEAALTVWEGITMTDIRSASIELTQFFIEQVEQHCPSLSLASPRLASERGSQVSFYCEDGYAVMQALIHRNVIGDFRAPNIIRFGFTPLYLDKTDVAKAVDILREILDQEIWKDPLYHKKLPIT